MPEETDQLRVRAFVDQHSLDLPVNTRLLDLTTEVGELTKEYLTATSYGQKEFQAAMEWKDELGDVYFALLCLANKSEIDLQEALWESMAKYEHRLKEVGGPDVSESRDLSSS